MAKAQDAHNRRTFALAVTSLVVSVLLTLSNFAYQIWRDSSNGKSSVARFEKIETSLRLLTATVAPQLQKAVDDSLASAILRPSEAKEKANLAGTVITQLSESSVSLTKESVTKTSAQLNDLATVDGTIPEVWTTTGKFITYRSLMLASWAQPNLPSCLDQPLAFKVTDVKNMDNGLALATHTPFELDHCKIVLDSPDATVLLSQALSMSDLICNDCVIFYSGGPIVLLPQKLVLDPKPQLKGNIFFNNCQFRFSLPNVPPPSGQRLTKNVLVAGGKTNVRFEPAS